MYDDEAKKVAVKAIGTVETGMRYGLVSLTDAITVGVAQWWGNRAANILVRMRTENPTSWVGIPARLDNALTDKPGDANYTYWSLYYPYRDEIDALNPVLTANKAIQDNQIILDLDVYVEVAARLGIDKDANTQMMLMFFVAYHQSPKRAQQLVNDIGGDATLNQYTAALRNEEVLGRYKSRIDQSYAIISAMDSTGVDDPPTETPNPDEGGDSVVPGRPATPVNTLQMWGDQIMMHYNDGKTRVFSPAVAGFFTAGDDESLGADIPPTDPKDPDPDPIDPEDPDPPTGAGAAMVKWMKARIGKYAYTQGAGRLTPDSGNATDCSGLIRYCIQKNLGFSIGFNTESQYTQGTRIAQGVGPLPQSIMEPGDCIYMDRTNSGRSTVDHVEMYVGPDQTIGHGGVPYMGPVLKNISYYENPAVISQWYVRRFH